MAGMVPHRQWGAHETGFYANSTIRFSSILGNFSDAILLTNISLMHHFLEKRIGYPPTGHHARRISLPCFPDDESAPPLN
jgi:uncharacterized membrane protein